MLSAPSRYDSGAMAPEQPKLKRILIPLEDAKIARLLEASAATGKTIEQLIQEAVEQFIDQRRGNR